MALDTRVQKQISNFINSQFPRLYEEFGQTFIDFVTAYYEWMETEGPLYDSRRASDYQDIDTTVDEFIVYFKNKYLPNIQLETRSNVELLIKHSLDVYRSRGTIRSIDLLFRLVFGVGAEVYYPFDDVFQPSSGEWIIPRYIEVSTQDDLDRFVGKQITGMNSGATAFVESWVRKKSGSKQIDILYISALSGNFELNEIINKTNEPFIPATCPTMIGSLTTINITTGGYGFEVGDIIPIIGTVGYGGHGRVANISQLSGTVEFELVDGGYAYTANAVPLISEEVLSLNSVVPGTNVENTSNFFRTFETISQPLANILYESATAFITNNETISAYYGNGSVAGSGIVLAATNGNSANGELFVAVLSGNLAANATIYTSANAKSASIPVLGGYTDKTATGNVMSEAFTATLLFNTLSGTFIPNESLIAPANNATGTLSQITIGGAQALATIRGRTGVWVPGTTITGQVSGATANLVSIALNIGVIDLVNDFVPDTRAPLVGNQSGTVATLPSLNAGTGATFAISNTLLYSETVTLNTDYLLPYVATQLNAANYLFPAFPTANLATPLAVALTYDDFTIGRISALTSVTPGTGYTVAPMVRIFEKMTYPGMVYKDQVIQVANLSSSFAVGDVVEQDATDARGYIIGANSTTIVINKLSLSNQFVTTSNSTTFLTSISTGATANVMEVSDRINLDAQDLGEVYMGFNARISGNTVAANGSITSFQVMNSGWGYEMGESLTFTSNGVTATGQAVLANQGKGMGFYRTKGGFLSDDKKLQDNYYYQVSSYDIRASVAFNRYSDMLKALLHVAGTKAFGTYVQRSEANSAVNIRSAIISQGVETEGDSLTYYWLGF
jgi:hypothetical protein